MMASLIMATMLIKTRLARVKEELGDKEGAEDLRAEAVQSSQAGESVGSSRRI